MEGNMENENMKEEFAGKNGGKKMMPPQAKIGLFMNVSMGLTVSFILSTFEVIASGHFTVPMWLLSLAISSVLALLVGFFLPVQKAKQAATSKIKNPLGKRSVGNIIVNIFYVLIITTTLVVVMLTLAKHQMDVQGVPPQVPRPSILKTIPKSLLSSYIVSYIVTFILEPIYLKIALSKYAQLSKE